MKRKILFTIIPLILIIVIGILFKIIFNSNTKEKEIKTIKVSEVTHSIFYTPFYVAIENGYFEESGINIDLLLVSGSDNVAASVLSGDTLIGLAGPESALYVYNGNNKDYLQVFAGLTKRDGQFIVSRENKEFNWNDLKGKKILIGRSTGMPALSFYKALENEGINKNDVIINTSVEFAELAGSFIGGNGDFVNLFEPTASNLEKKNQGYVVQSVGASSNDFPYTAFYAKKSSITNNKELLTGFAKAINKGLEYTTKHNGKELAKIIHNQFSDMDLNDLSIMIDRYKNADVWLSSPYISKEFYNNLVNLLEENNLIKKKVYYKYLINNLYE